MDIAAGCITTDTLSEFNFFRGRVALYSLLKALGIQPGDQVALQAFTCVAVPEAILALGAEPLYIDVAEGGFNMDVSDLRKKITQRVKGVVFQHTFGLPGAVENVCELAHLQNIPVIEDCCHTYLSSVRGTRVGDFGAASFYSFEWGKPLVAGMGGSAVIRAEQLRSRMAKQYEEFVVPPKLRDLRIQLEYLGYTILFRPRTYWLARRLKRSLSRLGAVESSYNADYGRSKSSDFSYRMAPSAKKRMVRQTSGIANAGRKSIVIAQQYRSRIRTPHIHHPEIEHDVDVVFARYPLMTDKKSEILDLARKANVEVADWYTTAVHPFESVEYARVKYVEGSCPHAERSASRVITLPTHVQVAQRDIDRTVEFFNSLRI